MNPLRSKVTTIWSTAAMVVLIYTFNILCSKDLTASCCSQQNNFLPGCSFIFKTEFYFKIT